MADDVERRIIYLEVNASKAVDGSTAATRALAAFEKGASSAGGALDALEAATVAAGGAASKSALDLATAAQGATGLSAAYRTTTGSVLELVKASTAVTTSAQAQAAGLARLAEQRTLQTSLAETRTLMDSVSRSTQSLTAMYGSATIAVSSLASAESRHYQSSLAAAERYAQGVAGTVDKLKVAEAYQASLSALPQYGSTAATTAAAVTGPAQARAVGYMGTPGQIGLNAQQKVMLGYQLQDVFTSLAGGMNPALVAAQQGPQISMLYGGVGNMLSAIPKSLLYGGGAALGVGGIALAVSALKDLNDALETQKRRLGDVIGDQRLAAEAYDTIRTNALAAGEAIEKTTAKFEQFLRAGSALGATTGQTGSLLSIFNQTGKLGGATPNEQSAAAAALAQALKDSIVSASALDTILENMPVLGRAIADGLHLSVTQLKLMASEGDLTNKQVFDALLSQQDKVAAKFKEAGLTVGGFFEKAIQGAKDLAAWLYNIEITTNKTKLFQKSGPTEFADPTRDTTSFPLNGYGSQSLEQMVSAGEAGRFTDSAKQLQAQILDIGTAATKAAYAAVLAGSKIADKLVPDFQTLQHQTDDVNKALDALQNGLTSLDATKAAQETKRLTDALVELQQKTPYGQASAAVSLRQAQDALGMTPGQRAYAEKVNQISTSSNVSVGAASGVVDAQQLQMLDDMIAKQQLQVTVQTAVTEAMRGGKAAADGMSVAMAILGIKTEQLGNISPEVEERLKKLAGLMDAAAADARKRTAIDASKQYVTELQGIDAALKVVEQGAYAVRRAEAEAKAAREENGTGGLQMQVFDQQQALTDKTTLDGLGKEIALTNALAAAAGDVARQKAIQLDYDIKRAQEAAGPGAREDIALAMRAKNQSDLNREAAEGLASLQHDNDLAQQQLDIIRSGSPDMAAQLAMLAKRNDLLAKGADLNDPKNQAQIDAAGQNARIHEQLQFEKDAADATKRTWQNAYDDIQSTGADALYDAMANVPGQSVDVATTMKNIFLRAFAEIAAAAIIRPIVTPIFEAGEAAGIIPGGVVPAATGSTGSSFGVGGGFNLPGGSSLANFGGSDSWLGRQFSGVNSFLSAPIGSFFQSTPDVGALIASGQTGASAAAGGAGFFGNLGGISVGQGLGAAFGIGSGALTLLNGHGSTSSMVSGIGQMIGGAVSLIPGVGQIAGPLIMLGSSILGGALGGGPKIPPMPGLGYSQGTVDFTNPLNPVGSGGYAGAAGTIGSNVLGLISQARGTPIAGKLYSGTFASGTTHTWDGQQWQGQDYTSANLMSPTGQVSFIGGTGQGMSADSAAEALTAQLFRSDVLNGAIKGISDTLVKVFTSLNSYSLQATKDAIDFATAYDKLGKAANPVKDSLDALNQQFQTLSGQAAQYGMSLDPIDAERTKETKRTAQDFIDNMLDPLAVQMRALDDAQQSALASAQYINDNIEGVYADTNKIVDFYGKQRVALEDQYYSGAITNLQALIKSLTYGDLSNASPLTTMAGLRSDYAMTRDQALGGDVTAISNFSNIASQLATFGQQAYGSTADYEAIRRQIIADSASVSSVASGGGTSSASSSSSGGTTATVDPSVAALAQMVATLTSSLSETNTKLAETTAQIKRLASAAKK